MKHILRLIPVLFVYNSLLFAQTFDLNIENQQVNGTDLLFDIFIQNTGSTNIYLANMDLIITFNHENFINDAFTLVQKGDGSNNLSIWYSYGLSIVSVNRLAVNILQPPFSDQLEFDQRVQVVTASGPAEKIGTFKISTIDIPSGTAGLLWRINGSNKTTIVEFEPFSPWNQNDISGNGTYNDPSTDIALPVELSSFEALTSEEGIILQWTTESEVNNAGFEVYRSFEEEGDYQRIASYETLESLQGAGNSNTQQNYEYIDVNILDGVTHWYKLADVDLSGVRVFHGPVSADPGVSGGTPPDDDHTPRSYLLHQNFPNPFNPQTTIRFDIPSTHQGKEMIQLIIYNNLGMPVRTLYRGTIEPGTHEIVWDGRSDQRVVLPSGVYFTRLQSSRVTQTKKMLLVR